MRFLKDIIAKRERARHDDLDPDLKIEDEYEPEWAEEEDEPEWAEEDADDTIEFDPIDEAVPEPLSAEEPVVTRPLCAETPQSDPPHDDPEEAGQDDMALKIWEMFNEDDDKAEPDMPALEEPGDSQHDLAREAMKSMIGAPPEVPRNPPPVPTAPQAPQAAEDAQPAPRAGRVKTRMLGFHSPETAVPQVFDQAETKGDRADGRFPAGWIVVIEGPGCGTSFPLQCGVSTVGRGTDQKVRLDFGDASISRDSHAVIAYDEDSNRFYLGHTGKANLVRLNGRPVLSTEEIANFDLIRIGETTLRFVGFCGPEFAWDMTEDEEILHARAS